MGMACKAAYDNWSWEQYAAGQLSLQSAAEHYVKEGGGKPLAEFSSQHKLPGRKYVDYDPQDRVAGSENEGKVAEATPPEEDDKVAVAEEGYPRKEMRFQ